MDVSMTVEEYKEVLRLMTDKVINFEKKEYYEQPPSQLFIHKKRISTGKTIQYGKAKDA
jgi:hypothetical protein